MNNVNIQTENDKLVITIDIGRNALANARPSSTGKTVLVASTGGTVPVASALAAMSVSLNVMAKR